MPAAPLLDAFTELGVAMLSSVLTTKRAVRMNIFIMRAFVKLRSLLATHQDLARKMQQLEARQKDHEGIFAIVIQDIRTLAKSVKREFKKLKAPPKRKPASVSISNNRGCHSPRRAIGYSPDLPS